MQTFLPYPDFAESARALDRQRLGKQRVEAYQIVRALLAGSNAGWANHPAVRMWRGHGLALVAYTLVMCDEWVARGYKDSVRQKVLDEVAAAMQLDPQTIEGMCHQDVLAGTADRRQVELPAWLGREDLHASHRSNLLRKDSVWYGQFGWSESDDIDYVWPVPKDVEDTASTHTPTREKTMADESSNENMNREEIVEALREKGYDGPVSYTKARLIEMLSTLEAGGTIEVPKRGRRTAREAADKEGTPAVA